MTIQEIQQSITSLSITDKIQLLQLLTSSLVYNFSGIEKNPKVAGGSACIIRTRIPVWTLESLRRLGKTEAEILFDFPTLKAIDLVNAWSYINANIEEINKEIQDQEEC